MSGCIEKANAQSTSGTLTASAPVATHAGHESRGSRSRVAPTTSACTTQSKPRSARIPTTRLLNATTTRISSSPRVASTPAPMSTTFDAPKLFATVVAVLLIGLGAVQLVQIAERRAGRWRR